MYEATKNLNSSFIQEIICENTIHNKLGNNKKFIPPKVRSVNKATESVQLFQSQPPMILISGSFLV